MNLIVLLKVLVCAVDLILEPFSINYVATKETQYVKQSELGYLGYGVLHRSFTTQLVTTLKQPNPNPNTT